MVNMYNLLRGVCMFCHQFKVSRPVVSAIFLPVKSCSITTNAETQVCKYIAKLRLLEHGLLSAAQSLDELHIRTKVSKQDSEDEDNEEQEESIEDFEKRINLFVAVHLYRSKGAQRDGYKEGMVYQTRKDTINDFLKATITKKCQNPGCGA